MTRPRCRRCRKPAALRTTIAGQLCKRCAAALPAALLRDPTQPRPNADRHHRTTKRAGTGPGTAVGTTRPPTPKQPRNQPCPCGSSHKVRHCHGRTPEQWTAFLKG
jgi:hypothetical protein